MHNTIIMRNLFFAKEFLVIHFKTLKEYKTNIYLGLLSHLTFMIIISFTFFVLKQQFSEIFYWNLEEFILYLILMELFLFFFHPWFRGLKSDLLTGQFNGYLTKPVSIFLNQSLSNLKLDTVIIGLGYVLLLFGYFTYIVQDLNVIRALITVLFSFIGGILLMSVRCTINSLAFFMKENGFLSEIYFGNFTNVFSYYPVSFFKESSIKYLGLIVAVIYYATIPTDFYFGYIGYSELFNYGILLFVMISILALSSFILWKKGLEKYEGYN